MAPDRTVYLASCLFGVHLTCTYIYSLTLEYIKLKVNETLGRIYLKYTFNDFVYISKNVTVDINLRLFHEKYMVQGIQAWTFLTTFPINWNHTHNCQLKINGIKNTLHSPTRFKLFYSHLYTWLPLLPQNIQYSFQYILDKKYPDSMKFIRTWNCAYHVKFAIKFCILRSYLTLTLVHRRECFRILHIKTQQTHLFQIIFLIHKMHFKIKIIIYKVYHLVSFNISPTILQTKFL